MASPIRSRLRVAALFGCLAAFLLVRHAGASAVISEVLWMGSDLSASDEWVEIACTGSGSSSLCVLDGWTLTSVNTSGTEVPVARFGTGTVIASGSALVVGRFPASSSRLLEEPGVLAPAMTLPNTKLLLHLRDAEGNVRDTADDGIGDPMSGNNGKAPDPKASMVRIDLALSGELKENWAVSTTAEGLDPDALVLATPGRLPRSVASAASSSSSPLNTSSSSIESSSSYSSQISSEPFMRTENMITESSRSSGSSTSVSLYISELLPDPIGDDATQWIEITALTQVSLQEVRLRDDASGKSLILGSTGAVLVPGERRVFVRSVLPASLSHAGGSISLLRADGAVMDHLAYPALPEGVSYGKDASDGSPGPFCVPSPGTEPLAAQQSFLLDLQSGSFSAPAPHSINIQILPSPGASLAGVSCSVDFDDGTVVPSCNPPSHRYGEAGTYVLTATIVNYCGTTILLSQQIEANASSSSVSSPAVAGVSVGAAGQGASAIPEGERGRHAVFVGALPNPEGQDSGENEWIEIASTDAAPATFQGWSLRADGKTILLPTLSLLPATPKRLYGGSLHLTLRNTSGSVLLIDDRGQEQSRLRWTEAKPGQVITVRPEHPDGLHAHVTEVLDGDTFDALLGDDSATSVRVRLIGIDAPELKDRNPIVRGMAEESKKFLRALIQEKEVELNFDTNDQEDPYGRLLAYVDLPTGEHLQASILTEGMAWVTTGFTFKRKSEYLVLEDQAKKSHRGIWIHPFFDTYVKDQKSGSGLLAFDRAESENNSLNYSSIRLSEILSHPLSGSGEWIEVVNAGTGAVDLQGWSLDDDKNGGSKPWRVARSLPLAPGAFAIFPKSVTKLSLNDDGDTVRLLDPDLTLVDRVIVPKLSAGVAYAWTGEADASDPEEAYCLTTAPTPGSENRCIEPVAKARKTSSPNASAAKRKTAKKTVTRKEPTLSFASLLPQAFSRPAEDVVFSSSTLAVSLSLPQVLVIVLAAVVSGALSGVAAVKGMTLARRT